MQKIADCTAVACGAEFTMWVCEGKVWSAGGSQYGQLGHGTDHEYNAKDCECSFAFFCACLHARAAPTESCLCSRARQAAHVVSKGESLNERRSLWQAMQSISYKMARGCWTSVVCAQNDELCW